MVQAGSSHLLLELNSSTLSSQQWVWHEIFKKFYFNFCHDDRFDRHPLPPPYYLNCAVSDAPFGKRKPDKKRSKGGRVHFDRPKNRRRSLFLAPPFCHRLRSDETVGRQQSRACQQKAQRGCCRQG